MTLPQAPFDAMIRFGNSIRLTQLEVERFTRITAIAPMQIRSLDDLKNYVEQCKAHYWGASYETCLLRWLIDREHQRCLGLLKGLDPARLFG